MGTPWGLNGISKISYVSEQGFTLSCSFLLFDKELSCGVFLLFGIVRGFGLCIQQKLSHAVGGTGFGFGNHMGVDIFGDLY